MTLCPARLEPIFSPRPWGTLDLSPFFPEMANLSERYGEAWLTGNDSRFANGPFAGLTLGEAWPKMSADWAGSRVARDSTFPLLVKFIFTEEKLSVQVHPPDDYAALHEREAGGRGKTEMWYVVRAREGAEVMVGLKPGVTRDTFRSAIIGGTAEDCLRHIPVGAGEALFVPAGAAHTIGPGLVLCEIQQHSDLTYRVYDYNRRDAKGNARPLHVDKALAVIDFGAQRGGKLNPVRKDFADRAETEFVACPYFATERWGFNGTVSSATSTEHFEILIFAEGCGSIEWKDQLKERGAEYGPGQAWLLPAALGEYRLAPNAPTSLLRTFVPPDLNAYAARLAGRGLNEEERSRVIQKL